MHTATVSRTLGAVAIALVLAVAGRAATSSLHVAADASWVDAYRPAASKILAEAASTRQAWERLAELGDTFGHRLSGSPALEAAIAWAAATMRQDGLDNVRLEKVMVPHWVRGRESLEIARPFPQALVVLGLGNSVGTGPSGIEAETLVVRSFSELETRVDQARGRIVVYNVPFTTYGETVQYRINGPVRAARAGARAVLLRSVGPPGLRTPHTGVTQYADGVERIPAAAIPVEDAEQLQRMQERGTRVVVRLRMDAQMLPDAEAANVIGELTGREKPEEVVVLGCHFDSWDVGTGSTDDGGGCIAAWEAVRLLKKLDLRPRRTVRVVLFVNEENGGRGGAAYRDQHKAELANHTLMVEADAGVFRPIGVGFTGNPAARAAITAIASLLAPIGATTVGASGGGADIAPSVQAANIPSMSLDVDGTRYFLLHHTPADTVDKIDPADLARCVATLAVVGYVVADMPARLGQ
jgi:carboxypeptidase Q